MIPISDRDLEMWRCGRVARRKALRNAVARHCTAWQGGRERGKGLELMTYAYTILMNHDMKSMDDSIAAMMDVVSFGR